MSVPSEADDAGAKRKLEVAMDYFETGKRFHVAENTPLPELTDAITQALEKNCGLLVTRESRSKSEGREVIEKADVRGEAFRNQLSAPLSDVVFIDMMVLIRAAVACLTRPDPEDPENELPATVGYWLASLVRRVSEIVNQSKAVILCYDKRAPPPKRLEHYKRDKSRGQVEPLVFDGDLDATMDHWPGFLEHTGSRATIRAVVLEALVQRLPAMLQSGSGRVYVDSVTGVVEIDASGSRELPVEGGEFGEADYAPFLWIQRLEKMGVAIETLTIRTPDTDTFIAATLLMPMVSSRLTIYQDLGAASAKLTKEEIAENEARGEKMHRIVNCTQAFATYMEMVERATAGKRPVAPFEIAIAIVLSGVSDYVRRTLGITTATMVTALIDLCDRIPPLATLHRETLELTIDPAALENLVVAAFCLTTARTKNFRLDPLPVPETLEELRHRVLQRCLDSKSIFNNFTDLYKWWPLQKGMVAWTVNYMMASCTGRPIPDWKAAGVWKTVVHEGVEYFGYDAWKLTRPVGAAQR